MEYEEKKHKKVYTSGPIAMANREGVKAVQDLWVSVTNFSKHPVTVKVEMFNWGDPAVSAGLTTVPLGMSVPMNAMSVPVMPAENAEIHGSQTKHFFADLLATGPLSISVFSYEIRVTVISDDCEDQVIFNAAFYSTELEDPEETEEPEEPVEEEEEEEEEGGLPPRLEALLLHKDFMLLEESDY
ncbi:hypothetical protein [Domibacillus iocasae]|uniref:Uncharacterized protein n=1 Tax=Domibacillus iocasae TaxID=1714016 RepID=A0A1E7DQH4_9BACI|nr:hypothetical protein [Domibacillus iocasae]OES45332.1 hypothetical protein BA724_04820 [Domibacillus iocasae]